jgi:hypothetical protein
MKKDYAEELATQGRQDEEKHNTMSLSPLYAQIT